MQRQATHTVTSSKAIFEDITGMLTNTDKPFERGRILEVAQILASEVTDYMQREIEATRCLHDGSLIKKLDSAFKTRNYVELSVSLDKTLTIARGIGQSNKDGLQTRQNRYSQAPLQLSTG